MPRNDVCAWCLSKIQTPKKAPKDRVFYCSPACCTMDWMFMEWQSDEQIMYRREFYKILTEGKESK